jgi:arsenate reductase
MKRRVLFLCTGNSCRSQMAEAIVQRQLGESWEAASAGTEPSGYVHPKAIAALAEIGIDWTGHTSKHTDQFRGETFDVVITVCDDAAENCPVWLGPGQRKHLGYPDPAQATGSEEEIMAVFRRVRDDIARQIPAFLREWSP